MCNPLNGDHVAAEGTLLAGYQSPKNPGRFTPETGLSDPECWSTRKARRKSPTLIAVVSMFVQ
jgi:hypothetical protein